MKAAVVLAKTKSLSSRDAGINAQLLCISKIANKGRIRIIVETHIPSQHLTISRHFIHCHQRDPSSTHIALSYSSTKSSFLNPRN